MVSFVLSTVPVAAPARCTVLPRKAARSPVLRRGTPFDAGEVNDPEKTAKRKEEKKSEYWGEPHNNNPLEKTTKAHDVELSNAVEDAGDSIKEGAAKLGDKIKEATGQK